MPRFASVIVTALVALTSMGLEGQEVTLRPLSEHMASDDDPTGITRYTARRCSVLFSLVGERYEGRRDQATADMYANWSIGFELAAARADIELGATAEEALRNNEVAIGELAEVIRARLNRTRTLGDDPLLSSDMRICRDLVDVLGL